MTRHRVAELDGALLLRATAMALGMEVTKDGDTWTVLADGVPRSFGEHGWRPDLAELMERNRIECGPAIEGNWYAEVDPYNYRWGTAGAPTAHGPNPITAAMRAKVASVYGEWVDLP